MGSTFGKDDELNRPDLGNYRLQLPYALVLKRSPARSASQPSTYQTDIVVLQGKGLPGGLESYSVDEDMAVMIRPTMDGGKYITNRGMIIKDIVVSGTTGYMPTGLNPGTPSVGTILNPSAAQAASETRREQNSGFLRFIQLRNLIREYARIKRFETPEVANSTFLFFYDSKLDEWWTVEPQKFRLFRSNKKPFMYDYSLPLRTISPGSDTGSDPFNLNLPNDKQITSTGGLSLGLSGIANEALSVVSRLQGIARAINQYAGQFTGAIRDAFNAVLAPLDSVTSIFANVAQATETMLSLPSGLYRRLMNSLDGMLSQVTRLSTDVGLINATNDVYIETRQLSESLFANAPALFAGQSSTSSPQAALAKENAKYTDQHLLFGTGNTGINDPQGTTTLATSPFVNGSGFNLLTQIDFTRMTDTLEYVVMVGETLEGLALRTTGTVFTVPMIKRLNKLQFPYIVAQGAPYTPGTVQPGDKLLVPALPKVGQNQPSIQAPLPEPNPIGFSSTLTASGSNVVVVTDSTASWRQSQWAGFTFTIVGGTGAGAQAIILDNTATTLTLATSVTVDTSSQYTIALIQQQKNKTFSPLEVRYGADVRLVFPATPVTPPICIADVVIGPTGDLVSVGGLDNYIQAMLILGYTERSRNLANPYYGIDQNVGERNSQENAVAYALSLRAGILADPRTQAINSISFSVNHDVESIVVSVTPVGGTQQVLALPSPV
jgi:hypothetical protein